MRYPTPVAIRFWPKVEKTDGCWNWKAFKDNKGYGRISLHSQSRLAHRISLELAGVELVPGLFVDHICRNRACVRPEHLRQVTPKVNTLENSLSRQAQNAKRTHCIRGHELAGGNLYKSRHRRACRTCQLNRLKEKRAS